MTKKPTCDLCKKAVAGRVYFDRVMRRTLDADYMLSPDQQSQAHTTCLIEHATSVLNWK